MLTQLKSRMKNPEFTSKLVLATFALVLSSVIGSRLWTLTPVKIESVNKAEHRVTQSTVKKSGAKFSSPDVESSLSSHYPSSDPYFDSHKNDPYPFAAYIREVSAKTDVAPALILAVVKTESNFRTHAESHAGAVGLMQVIAGQGGKDVWQRVLKQEGEPTKSDLKDPYTNLLLGSAYLQLLKEHYFKQVKNEELRDGLVLAAYNWGVGNVKKMLTKGQPRTLEELHWSLWQRAPKETYSYVKKVMRRKAHFETHYQI